MSIDHPYRVIVDAIHQPWAIIHEAPSYRAPWMVRITWRPTAEQSKLLIPEWIIDKPVTAMRDYDERSQITRWMVIAPSQWRDVILETVKAGDRMVRQAIPPPKTRTPGRWFTWEGGRWHDQPNHDTHLPWAARWKAEYWHTPPWCPGQDMRPHPPTDPTQIRKRIAKLMCMVREARDLDRDCNNLGTDWHRAFCFIFDEK